MGIARTGTATRLKGDRSHQLISIPFVLDNIGGSVTLTRQQ